MSQAERIFNILLRLKDRQTISVREYADKYEVSGRTVKRDIEYIRDRLSVDLRCSGGEYSISDEEILSLNRRQAGQGLLFFALLDSFSRNHFLFPLDYKDLRDKWKLSLSDDFLDLTGHISYEMSEEKAIKLDLFHELMASIQKRKQLKIQYSGLDGEVTRRRIEPYHLRNSDGQWYLLAWCHLRGDLRIFHVSRVTGWGALERPFSRSLSSEECFRVLDSGFGIMTGGADELRPVSILFRGTAVKLVEGKRWHREQVLENVPEGVKVTFPAVSFEEILRVVLSYHTEAEVLEPPEFRELWLGKIREMGEKFL